MTRNRACYVSCDNVERTKSRRCKLQSQSPARILQKYTSIYLYTQHQIMCSIQIAASFGVHVSTTVEGSQRTVQNGGANKMTRS
jgi:hypothetical protein